MEQYEKIIVAAAEMVALIEINGDTILNLSKEEQDAVYLSLARLTDVVLDYRLKLLGVTAEEPNKVFAKVEAEIDGHKQAFI